ncbi:DEAD/DEAH box helicase [Natronoglycomyces albus]|uniref:DEAD/DEAH box helicase n=2 Tax=Natronoglycomyces albus TaxID=2811108 RepID=A0A895XXR7_9ACTN|nr:DEAD/DEAH box helicase [Natronoglycomyces albus]
MAVDSETTTAPASDPAPQAEARTEPEATVAKTPVVTNIPADEPPVKTGPSFADLNLPLKLQAALAEAGLETPFPIQAATIPDALAGIDVMGRGRTGSGKTLAFGLPTLARLSDSGKRTRAKHPRALILTPTRELAMQVADSLQRYGDAVGMDMKVVCGGTAFNRQIDALRRGVDMLVATPGRLRDLIRRGECFLDEIEVAVLDEADQMADMGFLPEVQEIFDLLPQGQRMLFSATLEKEIGVLVKKYLKDPVEHSVDPSAGSVSTMSHHALLIRPHAKSEMIAAIASRPGRSMIFVRTQMACDRIGEELRDAGVDADALHGGMTQQARTEVLKRFKEGRLSSLVATDVAARGIHVDGVDFVLHADPAKDHKDYLHRAGRTARAGESGTVATLVLPHQNRQVFSMFERAGVKAARHFVDGLFDEDLASMVSARTLTELEAQTAARQAKMAESEVERMQRRIQKLTDRAAELHQEAVRLQERAEREIKEGPKERPRRDDRPRRNKGRYDDRRGGGQGGGGRGRYGRGDRNDRRGGGRDFRGGDRREFGDRDDRRGGGRGDRDFRGGDRREVRSDDRRGGGRDFRGGDRRDFRDRDDRRGGGRGDRDSRGRGDRRY